MFKNKRIRFRARFLQDGVRGRETGFALMRSTARSLIELFFVSLQLKLGTEQKYAHQANHWQQRALAAGEDAFLDVEDGAGGVL